MRRFLFGLTSAVTLVGCFCEPGVGESCDRDADCPPPYACIDEVCALPLEDEKDAGEDASTGTHD